MDGNGNLEISHNCQLFFITAEFFPKKYRQWLTTLHFNKIFYAFQYTIRIITIKYFQIELKYIHTYLHIIKKDYIDLSKTIWHL